ncbi:MAG: ABC transporter ATP-binding protein [Cyanothece sp. SIO2G6]|nr:ABC transporter ATP-binding protein [Cyanothece sp. SIO2G6]
MAVTPTTVVGEAIALHQVSKIFNPEHCPCVALNQVSLTIPKGAVQMVVGPSGAGKTTLLLTLAGLLSPTSGRITALGEPLTTFDQDHLEYFRRRYMGLVFQESNLLRSLTALENVEAMIAFRGNRIRIPRHHAKGLLESVGLGNHLRHLPRQLSGGQQQRVAIARALAGYPPLILADEPTASLDSGTGCTVVNLMRQLAHDHGCTVIITTHDTRLIQAGDRIAHINDGVLTLEA